MRLGRVLIREKSLKIFLLIWPVLFFAPRSLAAPQNACSLPQDLQLEVAKKYPGAKIVNFSDLEPQDKGSFQSDHGAACPGLTKADFYGDGQPTLAVELIVKKGQKDAIKLIVGHKLGSAWNVKTLDAADRTPAPVVWTEPSGNYADIESDKKLKANHPVIVFCAYGGWAIVYAWVGNRVDKVWTMD